MNVRRRLVVMLEEPVLDVRPEFLQHLRDGVGANLFAELGHVGANVAIVRIISVRNGGPRRIAHPFGKVKTGSSRIGACHHYARERIPRSAQLGTRSQEATSEL